MREALTSDMLRVTYSHGCAILVEYLDGGPGDPYDAVLVEVINEGAVRVVMVERPESGPSLYRCVSLEIESEVLKDRIRWFSGSPELFFDDESVDVNSDSEAVWSIAISSNGMLSRILSSRWRIPRSELGLLRLDHARALGATGRVDPIVDFAIAVRQAAGGL
jgi:hypothetical protein